MSGNSILTNTVIAKESLRSLKNNLVLAANVNRQYSKEFAKSGAKIGDTFNVRLPNRYEVTSGAVLNIQGSVDSSIALRVSTQKHVGLSFTSADRALSLDMFKERVIDPAMIALANDVDYNLYQNMYKQVYHSVGVPSASALPSSLKGFGQARAKIAKAGGRIDALKAIVDYDVEASLVNGLSGLFQAQDALSEQYKKGSMGMASGMDFYASQNVAQHTIGQLGGTPLTNYGSAYVAGSTSLVTDGWTASAANRLKEGDVFTIDNVYAINPQTRQSTGALKQWVATADADSDGSGNCTISFAGAYASGPLQNVNALPADGAAIKTFGHASSYASVVAPQNLVFDKDAFALAFVDLAEVPGSVVVRDEDLGLSMRLWEQGDINNDRLITRIDVMYGFKCIRPEYACRVVGQPA
jgi:hypothetical protein